MKRNCSIANADGGLICAECGNKERFIEVMDVEIHLVNGRKDYQAVGWNCRSLCLLELRSHN